MPNYTPTELEAFVRQRAPQIATEIRDAACKACNEADLVAAVERIIEKFAANFDVTLHLSRERTLVNGRADAVYNRFVIEYEPPNSLRKELSACPNQHAIGQVKQYVEGLERLDRHKKERLAGAVLDGTFFIFVRYRDDHWRVDDPLPVSPHSTETFLRYLLSLSTEKALTPDNLLRDFGENSNIARQVVPAIYRALMTTDSAKVETLFRQWQRQFREVSGYDPQGTQLDAAALARSYAVKEPRLDLERLFFALHTYYATFIKLLALQVAHYYLMPKVGSGLGAAADYDADKLRGWMAKMERGGLFAELGIKNFLEGDFFVWYLDAWDAGVEAALRRLIGELADYSLVTLDVDPEETRDLLKQLYQNLMPRALRHALGEYYTPDWLAERVLNQLGYEGDPGKRLLDPACGSGTFLVLALKRARKYADDKMLPPAGVLEQLLSNVVGFDLNPLAVISARTNYLLALGDLLEQRKGEISIPVYLADSILTPSMEISGAGQLSFLDKKTADRARQPGYSFNTAVGRFTVPKALVDARYIDRLAELLEECVDVRLPADGFRERLLRTFPLDSKRDAEEVDVAVDLYGQLQGLEEQEINGIWARIIKNAFAPLFQGKFDYVAGNPPWVNWENLPADYRQETVPIWQRHGLYSFSGYEAILGRSNDDISILMAYVALDQYVADKGRLGFVITQSVFKTVGGGQGFRRFRLGDGTPLRVAAVDDMAALQPFSGATNRTSIVILWKNALTAYPVPYNMWYKPDGGSTISEDLTLSEITGQKIATFRKLYAMPVAAKDPTSPWLTATQAVLSALSKVQGASVYQARVGTSTWLNGVYWVEIVNRRPDGVAIISNITHGARRRMENVQAAVETDLLHPLLRGRDVQRWQANPQSHILVTHEPDMGLRAIPEASMAVRWPKAYAYFKHFEAELRSRSGYKQYFRESDPFYSMFNIGDYTFAPYKVVWREQAAGLTVAVVEPQDAETVIPDHKLMLVACDLRDEAHFLCGALNSSPGQLVVLSYGVTIQMDTHVLENVRVPKYDRANPAHVALSDLSQQAHAATTAGDAARVREIEAEIDRLAAQLWGLTDAELKEIQESLAELG